MMSDLFQNAHVEAALYFTDQGHYLFKWKNNSGRTISPSNLPAVSVKSLREPEVSSAFTRKGIDTGYIQEGIVRIGHNSTGPWFVFVSKPGPTSLLIETNKITIPLPLLVFVGMPGRFLVVASSKEVFDPAEVAYQAPLPNVNSLGSICWGEQRTPKVKPDHARETFALFIESPFSAHSVDGKSKKYPKDVRTLYATLENKAKYPVKDLASMNETIGQWINRMVKENK